MRGPATRSETGGPEEAHLVEPRVRAAGQEDPSNPKEALSRPRVVTAPIPKQFPDANRFDITRDPNPHLAFGHGIHHCIGTALGRLEARIALTDILDRLHDVELASAEPWEPRRALHVHGPARLPIRFAPGARTVAAGVAAESITAFYT